MPRTLEDDGRDLVLGIMEERSKKSHTNRYIEEGAPRGRRFQAIRSLNEVALEAQLEAILQQIPGSGRTRRQERGAGEGEEEKGGGGGR